MKSLILLAITLNRFHVHTYRNDDIVFLCLADEAFRVEAAYGFLDELKAKLYQKYSLDQIKAMLPYGINFSEEMRELMEEYSKNEDSQPQSSKKVVNELSMVKDLTVDNLGKAFRSLTNFQSLIVKVLDRDIKINVVMEKSKSMQGLSVAYRKTVGQ